MTQQLLTKKCKCGNDVRADDQRYCRRCHNEYMRSWRPSYGELSEDERRRNTARSYLNVYVGRGKIVRPAECSSCGHGGKIEGHHWDGYDKPLSVEWLCGACHRSRHSQ